VGTGGGKRHSVLPGFGLSVGFAVLYLSLLVLTPLAALLFRASMGGTAPFVKVLTDPQVLASVRLSFGAAFVAAALNGIFGLAVAWVLARYSFPGRRLVDSLIDLPFALPTAVAGIALTSIYAQNGWIGRVLEPMGLKIAFQPAGVVVALTFIGLPFVVRTLQPVIEGLDPEVEEAAVSLGASRAQTFVRIILPMLLPAWLTGFALAFARALGEYGSVVFISGNRPMHTEIVPLLIMSKLEQYDYAGAMALAVLMLLTSFLLLFVINVLQFWSSRRGAGR
jgi:sulfate/thiosulfate transport system permease protein